MQPLDFINFPSLYTPRLVLRQLTTNDAEEIFFLRSDPAVNQFLDRNRASKKEDALGFIQKIEDSRILGTCLYWAITLNGVEKLIGAICLFKINSINHTAEIGYELHPSWQGKGLMQESIESIIDFGFNRLQLNQITATVNSENEKSILVLERNGFIHESNFRFETADQQLTHRKYILDNK